MSLIIVTIILPLTSNVSAQDSFTIDVKLLNHKSTHPDNWYEFPENYQLNVSNSTVVCPSNNCKTTLKGLTLTLDEENLFMDVFGDFKLIDDDSNGNLTPKKQNLIEQMSFHFPCHFSDIQETISSKTTKYICSDDDVGNIDRNFNSTHYQYTFRSLFELPSRHYILNATEAKEVRTVFFEGKSVFRNEDGSIEIK